jgi:hypothetical protein
MKTTLRIEHLEQRSMMAVQNFQELVLTQPTTRLGDMNVRRFVQSYYQDGYLSRSELVQVVKSVTDNNIVDRVELNDLKILASGKQYKQDFYATKMIENMLVDPVNNKQTISVNTRSSEVFRLVDKWFYGKDRPAIESDREYKYVQGAIVVNGMSSADIQQGHQGDCSFLATLAACADTNSINNFAANEDTTFTFWFYRYDANKQLAPIYVTVDRFLPVWKSGSSGYWGGANTAVYANFGGTPDDGWKNELWVAMEEKAYAQFKGWRYSQITTFAVLDEITGKPQSTYWDLGWWENYRGNVLLESLNRGDAVVAYIWPDAPHGFSLKSYKNGIYELINPWGESHLNVTWEELKTLCYGFSCCSVKTVSKQQPVKVAVSKISVNIQPKVFVYVVG